MINKMARALLAILIVLSTLTASAKLTTTPPQVLESFKVTKPNSLVSFINRYDAVGSIEYVYLSYGLSPDTVDNLMKARALMIIHEGYKHRIYADSLGNLTVGVGHLIAPGDHISTAMVEALLFEDLLEAKVTAEIFVKNWNELTEARQRVLIDMAFNLGQTRLYSFINMRKAIEVGDFNTAAAEMENSLWCNQVKLRCRSLSQVMRVGEDYYDLSTISE